MPSFTDSRRKSGRSGLRARIGRALVSCATEADVVQVLYAELRPHLGYDVINLQVLEREGWYHSTVTDHGLLQDVYRRRVEQSSFAANYERGQSVVSYATKRTVFRRARGPGQRRPTDTAVWVPILQRNRPVGAVIYQLEKRRQVPAEEVALLEAVHVHLGVVVTNAYLNELSRNQAVSLTALNAVARALSATHDEDGVVTALAATLGPLVGFDALELIIPGQPEPARARLVRLAVGSAPTHGEAALRSPRLREARRAMATGAGHVLRGEAKAASAFVPVVEGGELRAVLAIHSGPGRAYEQSTLAFFEQVADQVALALRNAWSYAAIEAQRRHLEVVNAAGRRLATALDSWSIMRALREELSRHLDFDIFSLVTVNDTPAGPAVEGYVYDSGVEQPLGAVPLAVAGPCREAYETGRPVLIRRSPWARELEADRREGDNRVFGPHSVLLVTRPGARRHVAARSILWVPVRHGDRVSALLSLQSYHENAFGEWHVRLLEDVAAHTSLALATASHLEQAQNERRRLDTILRHSPVGVLLEDADRRVVFVNPVIERLYGVAARDLIGRQSDQVIPSTACLVPTDAETETGALVELRLADRVVRIRRVPIQGSQDQTSGVLTLHEDVTQERALMDAKDLMLRAIGHEVRSPAAAIRTTIAGLAQWGAVMDAGEQRELIASAYEQSERLLNLVESQLIIARLEIGRFDPNPVPVSVPRTVEQVIKVLSSRYGSRAEQVDRRFPARLPDALCEAAHLEQVLTNLVGNALEHTEAARIAVRARAVAGQLEVAVEDTGGGLPPERADLVFDRAFAASHRARGGLGLGLYLCRLVVERSFGGRIWVDRTGRRGTTFKFTVPTVLEDSAADERPAAAAGR